MLHEHDKGFARWWTIVWIIAMVFIVMLMEIC